MKNVPCTECNLAVPVPGIISHLENLHVGESSQFQHLLILRCLICSFSANLNRIQFFLNHLVATGHDWNKVRLDWTKFEETESARVLKLLRMGVESHGSRTRGNSRRADENLIPIIIDNNDNHHNDTLRIPVSGRKMNKSFEITAETGQPDSESMVAVHFPFTERRETAVIEKGADLDDRIECKKKEIESMELHPNLLKSFEAELKGGAFEPEKLEICGLDSSVEICDSEPVLFDLIGQVTGDTNSADYDLKAGENGKIETFSLKEISTFPPPSPVKQESFQIDPEPTSDVSSTDLIPHISEEFKNYSSNDSVPPSNPKERLMVENDDPRKDEWEKRDEEKHHSCIECGHSFWDRSPKLSALCTEHAVKHDPSLGKFACTSCDYRTLRLYPMFRHLESRERGCKGYRELDPPEDRVAELWKAVHVLFPTVDWDKRFFPEGGRFFRKHQAELVPDFMTTYCSICDAKIGNENKAMKNHILVHLKDEMKPYKCQNCQERLWKRLIANHMRSKRALDNGCTRSSIIRVPDALDFEAVREIGKRAFPLVNWYDVLPLGSTFEGVTEFS